MRHFSNWYGFDTENDERGEVTLCALVDERGGSYVWKNPDKFVRWCENCSDKRPVVVCHNLEYDLVNVYRERYGELNLCYVKDRLIYAQCGRVSFLDSFNHFRMPLADLGAAIGIKKLEMDIYSADYVATDAWISLQAMVRARDYIASLGGSIGATAGSSGLSIWRAMTDDEYMVGPVDGEWYRKGYYGGRVEIFRREARGAVRVYDVNSMYPFSMLGSFPLYFCHDRGMRRAKGMAEATVIVPEQHVTPLAWRDPEGRLLYPAGVIRGVWTYDELRYAERCGARIVKIHKAIGSNCLARPFEEYIRILYKRRQASKDPSERLFLKMLLNSLYGKLAQRSVVTRTVSRYNLLRSGSKRVSEVRWITLQRGLLDFHTPPGKYVVVPWAAQITANARITLTRRMRDVPPGKLLYCDTDSIFTVDHELTAGSGLGQLKLERTAKYVRIVQPKAYQIDDFYRAKGVPQYSPGGQRPAKAYVETGLAEFRAPLRFRASLRRLGGKPNEWLPMFRRCRTEYKHKTLSGGLYHPPVLGK